MLNVAEFGDSPLVNAVNASFDFWAWALAEERRQQRPTWELSRLATQAALLHLPDAERSYADADEIADMTLIMFREPELVDAFKEMLHTHMNQTELSAETYRIFGTLHAIFDKFASLVVSSS